MRLEGLPGLKQGLQAGKNTWPPIGAGSVSGVILSPLVMRHCYFGGFGLGHQFEATKVTVTHDEWAEDDPTYAACVTVTLVASVSGTSSIVARDALSFW